VTIHHTPARLAASGVKTAKSRTNSQPRPLLKPVSSVLVELASPDSGDQSIDHCRGQESGLAFLELDRPRIDMTEWPFISVRHHGLTRCFSTGCFSPSTLIHRWTTRIWEDHSAGPSVLPGDLLQSSAHALALHKEASCSRVVFRRIVRVAIWAGLHHQYVRI
jgi:hypothetical protein